MQQQSSITYQPGPYVMIERSVMKTTKLWTVSVKRRRRKPVRNFRVCRW